MSDVEPPTLTVKGRVPQPVREAVQTALEAVPNACENPHLSASDGSHSEATLSARYTEKPLVENGGQVRWLPAYRHREDFDAALRRALPDGWDFEHVDNHGTAFYHE